MVGRSKLSEDGICKDAIRCSENIKDRDGFEGSSNTEGFDFRKVDPKTLNIPQQRKDNE